MLVDDKNYRVADGLKKDDAEELKDKEEEELDEEDPNLVVITPMHDIKKRPSDLSNFRVQHVKDKLWSEIEIDTFVPSETYKLLEARFPTLGLRALTETETIFDPESENYLELTVDRLQRIARENDKKKRLLDDDPEAAHALWGGPGDE